jgi:hypothetical protein
MKNNESSETGCRWPARVGVWRIIGGAALALVAYGVITNMHDIRRYLRIRRM